MTRLAYVIGAPISHSLSPAIHNAAFAACGIDARYEPAEVAPNNLVPWIEQMRSSDAFGFNVTIPHKEAILAYLDVLEGDAALTGAANTVIVQPAESGNEGAATSRCTLIGTNTDTIGFRRSLAEEAGMSLQDQRVVILGAGGAARAISLVALQDGARDLTIANRHVQRAQQLLRDLAPAVGPTFVRPIELQSPSLRSAIRRATVVINATSVGLGSDEMPIDPDTIVPDSLVVDIVYNPPETATMRAARERGARVLGGLGMLVFQAGAAFERWTGVPAPISAMWAAARSALAA
jgi:shikimate dehydrogenase